MPRENSKKVVIINDIKSEMIEQAILILRNNGRPQNMCAGAGIIAEASEVINSYIKNAENTDPKIGVFPAKKKKNLPFLTGFFLSITAIGTFVALAYGVHCLIELVF